MFRAEISNMRGWMTSRSLFSGILRQEKVGISSVCISRVLVRLSTGECRMQI
jgi:hypothetical protein